MQRLQEARFDLFGEQGEGWPVRLSERWRKSLLEVRSGTHRTFCW